MSFSEFQSNDYNAITKILLELVTNDSTEHLWELLMDIELKLMILYKSPKERIDAFVRFRKVGFPIYGNEIIKSIIENDDLESMKYCYKMMFVPSLMESLDSDEFDTWMEEFGSSVIQEWYDNQQNFWTFDNEGRDSE